MSVEYVEEANSEFGQIEHDAWETRSGSAQRHWDRQVAHMKRYVTQPTFSVGTIAGLAMLHGATNAEACEVVRLMGLSITGKSARHYRVNLRRAGFDVSLDREVKKARREAA